MVNLSNLNHKPINILHKLLQANMTEQEYLTKRDDLFKAIANCSFSSYNFYHSGMDELTYEAGLSVELELNKLRMYRQAEFPIYYKGIASSVKRKMDVVVEDSDLGYVVCELKAVERIGDIHRLQLWSYMKLMNIHLGMLINFSPKGVYYESYELNEETGKCERV